MAEAGGLLEEAAATEVDGVDVDAKDQMCFKTATFITLKKQIKQM